MFQSLQSSLIPWNVSPAIHQAKTLYLFQHLLILTCLLYGQPITSSQLPWRKGWIQRSLRHRVHESSSGTSFAAVFGPLTTWSFSWGPPDTSHADGIGGSPPKFRNTLRETNASDRDRSIAPKDLDLYIRTIWPWKGISSFRKSNGGPRHKKLRTMKQSKVCVHGQCQLRVTSNW